MSTTTNIEIWNARRKKLDQELHAKSLASRSRLQHYLLEMKKTHTYIVRSSLTAARLDTNTQSVYDGTPGSGNPNYSYDEKSPFSDMADIDTTVTEAKERGLDVGKFNIRHHNKPHPPSEHKLVIPAKVAETPKELEKIPKYHSYTTLRNNILSDDDDVMRYYPYLGEDAGDDDINQLHLEETFVDRTRASAEEGKKNECAAMYTTFINEFLQDLDLSVAAVTNYLIGDISKIHQGANQPRNETIRQEALPDEFDLDDTKLLYLRENLEGVCVEELEKAEPVCRVFKQQTKVSIWEVVKRANQKVKDSISPAKLTTGTNGTSRKDEREAEREKEVAVLTGGNPQPYSLESYAALNCLLCFMHECRFHVNKDHDRLAMTAAEDAQDGKPARKGDAVILNLATNVPGWACMSKGSALNPWGKDKDCSTECFINKNAEMSSWSAAQNALLKTSAAVLKNNPRCACLIASIINKPCAEIYQQLVLEGLLPDPEFAASTPLTNGAKDSEPKQGAKRKKFPAASLPGYPPDCDRTHTHERRTTFQACRHLGHCTDGCPCVKSHVTCEKSCICSPSCPRRWRGCTCKREGKACTLENKCICAKAHRECDADLCHSCGASEALDPKNRYTETRTSNCCQNVALQKDMPRRTLLGRSSVAGFGLFMGENVKRDSFLGEYKGEVITSEEAERRGKLYDRRGVSFLFNLNSNQVIDATRAGNKFRYVNHSTKRPNCFAKVYMANCTHRIGMFARRDLAAGEELFFDYGYNNKQVKFVHKEPPEIPGLNATTGEKTRNRKPNKGSKTISRMPEYLKGGRGTTERSRAIRINSESSYSIGTTSDVMSGAFNPAIASVSTSGVSTSTPIRSSITDLAIAATSPKSRDDHKTSMWPQDSEVDRDKPLATQAGSADAPIAVGSGDSLGEQTSESDDDTLTEEEDEGEDDEPPRRSGSRMGPEKKRQRMR